MKKILLFVALLALILTATSRTFAFAQLEDTTLPAPLTGPCGSPNCDKYLDKPDRDYCCNVNGCAGGYNDIRESCTHCPTGNGCILNSHCPAEKRFCRRADLAADGCCSEGDGFFPYTEPVVEPTAEPVVETTAEPVAEPTAEPVVEPIAPIAEPATAEPVVAPADPIAAPIAE